MLETKVYEETNFQSTVHDSNGTASPSLSMEKHPVLLYVRETFKDEDCPSPRPAPRGSRSRACDDDVEHVHTMHLFISISLSEARNIRNSPGRSLGENRYCARNKTTVNSTDGAPKLRIKCAENVNHTGEEG